MIPELSANQAFSFTTLEEMERRYILDVLEHTKWRIKGKNAAGEILGLNPSTLHYRMNRLGVQPRSKQ